MDFGQDQMPQDDTMMQLELQRKLKLADALRQQEMPQGQMISGHYIAPHWTQQLAALGNQIVGGKQEENALKQYGQYQATKQAKLADLLAGKEVQAPVDYNEAGNMPGMTQTTRQPYNQQEFLSKAVGVMPDLAPKLIESQVAQYGKEEQPLILSEGAKAYKNGQLYAENPKAPKDEKILGNINPSDFTPASLSRFMQGGGKDYSVLERIEKPTAPVTRTMRQGMNEVTQQWNPDTKTWSTIAQGPAFAPEKPQSDVAKENLIFNKTRGLREDFAQLPETKSWNVIQPILVSVREAAKDTSGASDLNLIYGMGKIMDPNSVVREGELQMAGNTGNLGQRLQGYYKSIANGGKLPPAVKQDLLNQIESRAKPQQMLYENTKKKYTEIAKRNNLNPEDLFVEGITAPATSSARSAADAILGH